MLHLLLDQDKKAVRKEYALRLVTISLFFFFVTIILATTFLLPSFFLSGTKEEAALERVAILRSSSGTEPQNTAVQEIENTKKKLTLLKIDQSQMSIEDAIKKILGYKTQNVLINGIFHSSGGDGQRELKISGVAQNRESLVAFVKEIQNEKMFSRVDFPVSNFAKDKNIDFVVTAFGKF